MDWVRTVNQVKRVLSLVRSVIKSNNVENLKLTPKFFSKSSLKGPMSGIPLVSDEETQEHFDDFFEDVFVEIEDKYGEIDEMNVCDNLGDHLVGE